MKKNVWQVLKETNCKHFDLEIYAISGGLVGVISDDEIRNEMGLDLKDMKVKDYRFNPITSKATIDIREADNMRFIKLLYAIIAEWKLLVWEEHGN